MPDLHPYAAALSETLTEYSDPVAAEAMASYMKDHFPFFGLPAPLRRDVTTDFMRGHLLPPSPEMPAIVRGLYGLPQRELHYAAIEIVLRYKRKWEEDMLPLIEFLITENTWWDSVDTVASKIAGGFFLKYPHLTAETTHRWLHSDNMWLQRTVIIFQLSYGKATDTGLLFNAIRHCAASDEFFLRKAIGWALRQYSRTDPEAVRAFVESQPMSTLSKREALRLME